MTPLLSKWETFLYGLYVILFSICVYILCRKKTLSWILLSSAVVMFALATADIAYTYYLIFGKLMKGSSIEFIDLMPKFWLYITNKCVYDSYLQRPCKLTYGYIKQRPC